MVWWRDGRGDPHTTKPQPQRLAAEIGCENGRIGSRQRQRLSIVGIFSGKHRKAGKLGSRGGGSWVVVGKCSRRILPTRYRPGPYSPDRRSLAKPSSRGARAVHHSCRLTEQFCRQTACPTALAMVFVVTFAVGCQTPNAATTVAPPATGMIGQPAQYGSWATQPQGAAYPPSISAPPLPGTPPPVSGGPPAYGQTPPPMPGPATQWQSAGAPATPPQNGWSWSQPSATPPPSMQQYGQQLQNSAAQGQQNLTNQAQQYANQMQAQPQQWANQTQQTVANQQQQWNQQLQNTANQYQQGVNNQLQGAQQQMNGALQQAQQPITAQMQQYQTPPPANSWNPFATSSSALPPARATPATTLPSY